MAQQTINAGDALEPTSRGKINDNFTELYGADAALDTRLDTAEADIDAVEARATNVELNASTEASNATPTPSGERARNFHTITALAAAAAFAAPSGTPENGNTLLIRIKDNGTARALTWNAIYRAVGITLPTTTTISKTTYVGFIYNSADSKWDAIATVTEA